MNNIFTGSQVIQTGDSHILTVKKELTLLTPPNYEVRVISDNLMSTKQSEPTRND